MNTVQAHSDRHDSCTWLTLFLKVALAALGNLTLCFTWYQLVGGEHLFHQVCQLRPPSGRSWGWTIATHSLSVKWSNLQEPDPRRPRTFRQPWKLRYHGRWELSPTANRLPEEEQSVPQLALSALDPLPGVRALHHRRQPGRFSTACLRHNVPQPRCADLPAVGMRGNGAQEGWRVVQVQQLLRPLQLGKVSDVEIPGTSRK